MFGVFAVIQLTTKSAHSSHYVVTLVFMDTFDYFWLTHSPPVEV